MRRITTLIALLLTSCLLVSGCGKSSSTSTAAGSSSSSSASAGSSGSSSSASSDASGVPTDANGCPTSNTKTLAKTKFALHTGLAIGTFHRYIYKPYKAGQFQKGAQGRIKAFVKAGATALFAKREIRLASEDVKASPALCKVLAAPLRKLSDGFSTIADKIKTGNTSGIDDAQGLISQVTSQSAKNGAPIAERTDESAGG